MISRIRIASNLFFALFLATGLVPSLPSKLGLVALAFVLGVFILRSMGMGPKDLYGRGAPPSEWGYMFKYVPAMLITSIGLGLLSVILLSYLFPRSTELLLERAVQVYRGPLFVLLALVLAPVFEETLFRGMLFPILSLRWGVRVGMIVSALVFGFFHLNVLGATIYGLVAAAFYVRTSTLLVPIALHFFNNAISLALLLSSAEPRDVSIEDLRQGFWGAVFMALIGGAFILHFLRRNWPRVLPEPFERKTSVESPERRAA